MDDEDKKVLEKLQNFRPTGMDDLINFLEKLDYQKFAMGPTSRKANTVTLKDVLGACGDRKPSEVFASHLKSDAAKENMQLSMKLYQRLVLEEVLENEETDELYQRVKDKAWPEVMSECQNYFAEKQDD